MKSSKALGGKMREQDVANELKILALESINHAGSGHSGSVLSCGDILYTLYTRHLLSSNVENRLRDRFVLSNGHACAILYAILAGLNYFDIKEMKNFRSFGGMLTGHPEIEINGIDAGTGPLGQGVANAVGMAIAETIMNTRFNVNNYTYCMAGDGCLEEGVAMEALSIAGLYRLNKFILLYDKNDVTLDGKLDLSSTDDMAMKFRSMNFNVIESDGHDIEKIDNAITQAKKSVDKPTVIIFHTIIGKDTSLAGSNKSHGKVFDIKEIEELKQKYNIEKPYLDLSVEAKSILNEKYNKIIKLFNKRVEKFENHMQNDEKIKKIYLKFINNKFSFKVKHRDEIMSTREANNIVLNEMSKSVENLVILSADLSSSTKVKINDGGQYSYSNRLGKNIALGIREHAMGAIANGIALYGGLNVITSTFLTFSNYMLPAIRMSAIMKLPVLFVFTHSSIFDTPDGITHIPVEQLDQLRLIPHMIVSRPCDMEECVETYKWWFDFRRPICMSLSRCNLPSYPRYDDMDKGAYVLDPCKADINIMASGSEVCIANEVKDILKDKIKVNVISVPSLEIFDMQKAYKNRLLKNPLFVIESSTCVNYIKYTDEDHIFSVHDFGRSGDEASLKKYYGYTADAISKKILKILKKLKIFE